MSQTKNAVELCALLVEETYGELTCRIFTILLRRGRQSIPALVQYTRLPSRHIRHGLAVLIQQNLVYYHVEHDSDITFYEANQDASYFLLRSGKIIEHVQSRYGPLARDIVQNLLFLGHARIADLLEACRSRQLKEVLVNGDGEAEFMANGLQNGHNEHTEDSESNKIQDVLYQLLESGLVVPVTRTMLQSPSDLYSQVEREVLHSQFRNGTKGTKQKDELRAKVIERLRDIRSEGLAWQRKEVKRPSNGVSINGGEKRRKLANGAGFVNCGSRALLSENILDSNLVVRINYDKCTVVLRNQRLVSLAAREIGETTSEIYASLLSLLEGRIAQCQLDEIADELGDDDEAPSVSTMELARVLGKSFNPSIGIGKVDSRSINTSALEKPRKRQKRKFDDSEAAVEGDGSSDEDEDDQAGFGHVDEFGNIAEVDQNSDSHGEEPFEDTSVKPLGRATRVTFDNKLPKPVSREGRLHRMTDIKNHLLLLADHSPPFVIKCGNSGLGEWTVDFVSLVKYMQETEIDTIIGQSFGPIGSRIAQILRQKGKLDEKQIQKFGLLKLKDVRTKLVEMQMSGFTDIQEVPKDSTRAAGRTMFFWYFDPERVSMIVLERIYKTISRCLQVLNAEKHDERDILSQAERTDVKGQEAEMLAKDRLERLHVIRDKEKKIFIQIGRLDELVAIFKDF